jgi:hypothetical protein
LFRGDFDGLRGVVIFRSIDNPTPSQPTMVRPTHKSFELRKAIAAVEVGAFSKFICRKLSVGKPVSSPALKERLALSQHARNERYII